MSFAGLLTQTATITHVGQGAPGDYNMPTITETTTTAPTFVEPLSGSEDTVFRDTGVTGYRAFFLPNVSLTQQDRITVNGRTYECVEPPQTFYNPRTRSNHHIEVMLKEVT